MMRVAVVEALRNHLSTEEQVAHEQEVQPRQAHLPSLTVMNELGTNKSHVSDLFDQATTGTPADAAATDTMDSPQRGEALQSPPPSRSAPYLLEDVQGDFKLRRGSICFVFPRPQPAHVRLELPVSPVGQLPGVPEEPGGEEENEADEIPELPITLHDLPPVSSLTLQTADASYSPYSPSAVARTVTKEDFMDEASMIELANLRASVRQQRVTSIGSAGSGHGVRPAEGLTAFFSRRFGSSRNFDLLSSAVPAMAGGSGPPVDSLDPTLPTATKPSAQGPTALELMFTQGLGGGKGDEINL